MQWDLARRLARTERAQFLVDGLDLEAATDIPGAEWEPFQIAHLNDDGLLRHERKSRQIGASWMFAAEATANSILYPRTTSLFSSINREESAEKIRYAKQVYDSLYPAFRIPLIADNQNSLAFANGSRIISTPQRPHRGKARAWLYLDEFAHYRLDREVYQAGLPVTTKGGRLRIASTTLGARGMFWEIGEQRTKSYPGYNRAVTPWWKVGALLKPEWRHKLREVSRLCVEMGDDRDAAEERVARFASDRIADIYANLPLDDFLQEYETAYIDETMAYIPWADIQWCTMGDDGPFHLYWLARTPEQALSVIDELGAAIAARKITGPLVWGLDIGRKKDLTELAVVEIVPPGVHLCRAVLSLDRQSFETQDLIIRTLLDRLPIIRGLIDQSGLGMQLAENLYLRDGYAERALPMTFTMPTKALMATHIKTRFQRGSASMQRQGRPAQGSILIPPDRDLRYQIHAIRRRVTANNNIVFDVEQSERHHGDKFWALALANEAGETLERIAAYPVSDSVTIRTTHQLDSLLPNTAREPDLGDPQGFGLTREQYDKLIEHGIAALRIAQVVHRGADELQTPETADDDAAPRYPVIVEASVVNVVAPVPTEPGVAVAADTSAGADREPGVASPTPADRSR